MYTFFPDTRVLAQVERQSSVIAVLTHSPVDSKACYRIIPREGSLVILIEAPAGVEVAYIGNNIVDMSVPANHGLSHDATTMSPAVMPLVTCIGDDVVDGSPPANHPSNHGLTMQRLIIDFNHRQRRLATRTRRVSFKFFSGNRFLFSFSSPLHPPSVLSSAHSPASSISPILISC
jgi:hypothetical protein